jgi:hypothetical protein
MRRLKPATGLWKIQPQWVVTPRKQTKHMRLFEKEIVTITWPTRKIIYFKDYCVQGDMR